MKKNKFNQAWMHQHINDPYVKLAQREGYRARAAYKLKEIDEEDKLIRPGMVVVDLGSTPGSWSQVVREKITKSGDLNGRIIALDLLEMDPIAGVEFIQGDFREDDVLDRLAQTLGASPVDLVLSDMAPNLSGIASVDAARIIHVCELALEFAQSHLQKNGALLVKCFHGAGFDEMMKQFRLTFKEVRTRKPKASRDKSSEIFILGRGLK
ncbi:Ribosomal RNA large subunit methyltransferase E [Ephemeroptericola cinctiostellae]|uniref:Ribosomal RNA large subunit methyltransferase E n=1 Tax=Ephemeroptericola cinctiostellae TaxID=2268024 RepID=A0A345D9S5_9BURK|nr:RlmE family RNA methyltransferase [Ephemeroptericola cinctiostellae]AXF85113.1 Ribosomal RNA large subunit methyltransferase E [Ephemeroptericola cinctiostellae]